MQEHGYDVQSKTYAGLEHNACPEELDDVGKFLAAVLTAADAADA